MIAHLRVCWLAETGPVHSEASRPAGPPGSWCQVAAAGWPGEALVWVNSALVPGCAEGLSSGRPETPLVTTRTAAASGQSPVLSDWPSTREL